MAELESIVSDGRVRLRRMRDEESDYRMVAGWLNQPHVRRFWDPDDPPPTVDTVRADLQPDTRDASPSTLCIIEFDGAPVGYVQFYPWSAYAGEMRRIPLEFEPGEWGLDVFIGDPERVGAGIGSRAVELLCDHLQREHAATSVLLLTAVDNPRAQRAYEKAGFRREGEVLDLDTYQGERIRSLVMRRR